MKRTDQAKDWEQRYRDGATPWDKGEPAPPLCEWLENHVGVMTGEVLVPGCGRGHDVRVLATHVTGPVIGFDISTTAVKEAEKFLQGGGERYLVGDLFSPPEGWEHRFDWIWEHTCFCALEPSQRMAYVEAVATLLKPGGRLLGVFYLDPYDEEHRPEDGTPYGCSEEELRRLFVESGRFRWDESYVPVWSYPGREGRELMVRMQVR